MFGKRKKKEEPERNYHANYDDELFFNGIDLIKSKGFSEKSLVVLVSLLGVVLFKGDLGKFNSFLNQKAEEFKDNK